MAITKQRLKFINKSNNPDPVYAKEGDSGFDLRAWIHEETDIIDYFNDSVVLKPLERRLFHTGIYLEIPYACEVQVRSRSGLAIKEGLFVLNSPGTADSQYRGEICVILMNLSNKDVVINNGDRIAQAVLCPVYHERFVKLEKINEFENETQRGDSGFGSSGKN